MKQKQVQGAIYILSKYIKASPGGTGLASAVLIAHIKELEEIVDKTLEWWEEQPADTTEVEPEFITLAIKFKEEAGYGS